MKVDFSLEDYINLLQFRALQQYCNLMQEETSH